MGYCYNPADGNGRFSAWWEERTKVTTLLKGYITEMYAPMWIREVERGRGERKLSLRIAQLFCKCEVAARMFSCGTTCSSALVSDEYLCAPNESGGSVVGMI